MKELNNVLTELGISKVRLSKYLGVSRQMLYNYLALPTLGDWPKEKSVKLLSLLNISNEEELKKTGCITIAGRIDRKFFHEKFYGTREAKERRESNGSV